MKRKALETLVWKHKHADYKGVTDGVRTVLRLVPGVGTCRVALPALTVAERPAVGAALPPGWQVTP